MDMRILDKEPPISMRSIEREVSLSGIISNIGWDYKGITSLNHKNGWIDSI